MTGGARSESGFTIVADAPIEKAMSLLAILLNSRCSRTAGASGAFLGSRSVAGKASISKLGNACLSDRFGPLAATTSAMGIA